MKAPYSLNQNGNILNKSEFTNGLDLRNKYIHNTISNDEKKTSTGLYYIAKNVHYSNNKIQ